MKKITLFAAFLLSFAILFQGSVFSQSQGKTENPKQPQNVQPKITNEKVEQEKKEAIQKEPVSSMQEKKEHSIKKEAIKEPVSKPKEIEKIKAAKSDSTNFESEKSLQKPLKKHHRTKKGSEETKTPEPKKNP